MPARPTFTPPEQFEEYHILRPLGRGAMGQVYLALDTLLDRPVAIKFIAGLDVEAGQLQEQHNELRERFFIEARAVARLQHPNVVSVYRVGEWQKRPYLVSEFVRGQSLDRIEKPVPWQRVHNIAIGLSRGLAAAHRRGVLHRDIKPANAMLTPAGDIKLLDFGLAKLIDVTQGVSGPGMSFGATTPQDLTPLRDTHLDIPIPTDNTPVDNPPPAVVNSGNELADTYPGGDPHRLLVLSALDATLIPDANGGPARGGTTSGSGSGSGLTRYGDVIGSPLYIAPEIWRGEPATRRADIYSLGVLLYELCSGRTPHEGVPLGELPVRVQEREATPLAQSAPDADPRFCAIVDRCLRRSPSARYESGDALRAALEQLLSVRDIPSAAQTARSNDTPTNRAALGLDATENPYRGLQSFEKQHRGLFFGRAAEIGAIVDRLRSESFILIAGNSGVGKSSLCKAGVLPLIESGALGPIRVVPWQPGKKPLSALAAALAPALEADEATLRSQLESDPQEIGRQLCRRIRQSESAMRVLVFVDQMEELLTQGERTETALTGEALAALLAYGPELRLIGTVRSDFLSRLVMLPAFGVEMARGLHLLGPLPPDGLREAITQPALFMGYAFESAALVENLVNAAGQGEGGLPLLQFTLTALWETRDHQRRIIPAAALQALGGVGGALAKHADQVYGRLSPRQQLAARRMLGHLITLEGARTSKRREELLGATDEQADAAAALEALVAGRIISVRSDETNAGSIYEVAHESLLSGWDRLRTWLAEDAQLRGLRQRLALAAREWERLGRTRELLWQKRQLAEAEALAAPDAESMLTAREAAFLTASQRAARLKRFGQVALIGVLPMVLFLGYGVSSLRARHALNDKIVEHTVRAQSELVKARELNQRTQAMRQAAWRLFDSRKLAEGEKLWSQVMAMEGETRQQYRLATRTAEATFLLNTRNNEQRRLVANILFERILLAEIGHRLNRREDLYQRLVLYDADGSIEGQSEAPASVEFHSEPRGVAVLLTPIDNEYHLVTASARQLGRTPLGRTMLPTGSYLLTLAAPGRVEVKYPFYLRRGELLSLRVELPTAERVPPGYSYVPAGRFLFGSEADDAQRREFFYHVPIHEVSTDAYIIAQKETTYADWLEFLRDMPPVLREKHLPRASQSGIAGWLVLQKLPDGSFELTTQPTQKIYRVREGERIAYPARKLRREQDWLKMPVTGISSEDALAYTEWLRSTGRLPGARLCTEIEWERAARGADARIFPTGNHLEPDDANFDQTYGQEPLGMGLDEVGAHPASRSVFDVDDLVGNAFEWVQNSVSPKEYALRGGAYYYTARTGRIDNRHEPEPSMHNPTAGMRVCASLPARM